MINNNKKYEKLKKIKNSFFMDRTIDSKTKNHITNISLFMQTTVICENILGIGYHSKFVII